MTSFCTAVALLVVSIPPSQEQRLGDAVCRLQIESTDLSLSGELRLTASIEGPAPVEVEAPAALTTSPDWRVRPGPPAVKPLPGGREHFEQSFQLEPFQVGEQVPLPLEPWHFRTRNEVRNWTLNWPALEIRVSSHVPQPDLSFARSITGIDASPPVPARRNLWPAVLFTAILIAVAAICGFMIWKRLRPRSAPSGSPMQRALAELHHLQSANPGPEQLPELADLLRRFLEQQFSLAATRQTSSEFCAALEKSNIGVPLEPLPQVFHLCDEVKFAGHRPDLETCRLQFHLAHKWLAETLQPALTESVREGIRKK